APHSKERREIDKPCYRGQHDRGENSLRQVLQQARKKQQTQGKRDRCKNKGEGSARTRLVVHGGLRQPASHRISLPHRNSEIGGTDAEKLLARIEGVTMLGGEAAGSGDS